MIRLSGRGRSALIIGLQGIRARKTRTLLSMISLFLGVLAVVIVQAGASIAEKATMGDIELQMGLDGTKQLSVPAGERSTRIVLDAVTGRPDAVAMLNMRAIVGEPGVRPVNEGGGPIGEDWGVPMECDDQGNCTEITTGGPKGQAIEMQVVALTGDVRKFRPYRQSSGEWLDFTTVPMMAPRLVLNKYAAEAFEQYRVPAEMRIKGASANLTPQFVGVVDDGGYMPTAYVRLDELSTWLGTASLSDPNSGELQVLLAGTTPVEQVLTSKLKAIGQDAYVDEIKNREDMAEQLQLMRLVFLSMAGLVLLIGVAGILNVGLATVGERVEEFALRRAVGTPRSLLAGIVLAETLITGLLTSAIAIGVSAAALKAVVTVLGPSEPLLRGVEFPVDAGVAGIVAGLIAGVLGGIIPAIRAAGIPIATVMRA
ncbi:FtsX-like permease family protein [Actinoplanes sp. NBRC 101535]|uniref:ABC transporter permease n=1 Tax=Actinoplanes sp. NBRC 101535 TaxID=3032196 RepID=UPI0024A1EFCF|nr:FtsX-like permease family protein [Actinoplanes sp. NBRC 101535]GLY00359.1 hypothetical protein Acsp01_07380 [Actinoplanes sp. NBRC 101535]